MKFLGRRVCGLRTCAYLSTSATVGPQSIFLCITSWWDGATLPRLVLCSIFSFHRKLKNTKKVRFPPSLNNIIRRHVRHPSAPSSRKRRPTKRPDELFDDASNIASAERRARIDAWDLNKEVYPHQRKSYRKEKRTFFCEGKRNSENGSLPSVPTPERVTVGLKPAAPSAGEPPRSYMVDSGASFSPHFQEVLDER